MTFFHDTYEGLEGFAKRLAGYEVLGVMRERSPIGRDLLERLPDVKLIATAGMRNAAIDLDYCKERGIAVCGTQNSADATPELAWGHIISLARNIHIENARMREGTLDHDAGPRPHRQDAGHPRARPARAGAWPRSAAPSTWRSSPGATT